MKKHYFVIVEKEKKYCYSVYSPDFKTVSTGDSFAEACENMRQAMEIYLSEINAIPDAMGIESVEKYIIRNCPHRSIKTVVDLELNLPHSHAVRLNICMPENILRLLDQRLAGKTNQRSRFITQAVERLLQEA